MPTLVPMNMSLRNFCAIHQLPKWSTVFNLPIPERIEKLRDPSVRSWLLAQSKLPEAGVFARLADFGNYVVGDTFSEANAGRKGRVVKDIAREQGKEPFDMFVEIGLNDELKTVWWPTPTDDDPASWALRKQVWETDGTLLGGSDAGAHLDRMCGSQYTTAFLEDTLRGRKLLSLERAVQLITDAPARLFGLRGRGRIAEGWQADLVLLDPATVGAEQAYLAHDLPAGALRLKAEATGIERVFVERCRDRARRRDERQPARHRVALGPRHRHGGHGLTYGRTDARCPRGRARTMDLCSGNGGHPRRLGRGDPQGRADQRRPLPVDLHDRRV